MQHGLYYRVDYGDLLKEGAVNASRVIVNVNRIGEGRNLHCPCGHGTMGEVTVIGSDYFTNCRNCGRPAYITPSGKMCVPVKQQQA